MVTTKRCGTGDSGCSGPAMNHSSSNMCNGVFAPVCAPEICNVPRIPHHEVLVDGKGTLLDNESQNKIHFTIFVEREMQVYKGRVEVTDAGDEIIIKAQMLKFFEGNGKTHMLAIFHEETTNRDIVVTVYQGEEEHQGEEGHQRHQEHEQKPTQIFIYSTSMEEALINLTGELIAGDIKMYIDHNVHEH